MKYLKKAANPRVSQLENLVNRVSGIIRGVQFYGDHALLDYNARLDGCNRSNLRVTQEEIENAYQRLSPQERNDLEEAVCRVRSFARAQRSCLTDLMDFSPGGNVALGHRIIPVKSCGCCVPGGSRTAVSTALMLIIPAKEAGVNRVAACSPAMRGKESIHEKTLAAMDMAGADEIYVMGGAQSVAAFAWGTEQVPAVDMVVGGGNLYSEEAKRQCWGKVGIDFLSGPCDVMIIAGESTCSTILSENIMAQLEHDQQSRVVLVVTSQELGRAVITAVKASLDHREGAVQNVLAWENRGEVIWVENLMEAVNIANQHAPKCLEVILSPEEEQEVLPLLSNFGALFLGQETGVAFGDYILGANHVLPGAGTCRYANGLWVGNFLKVCTVQRCTADFVAQMAPMTVRLAQGGGMTAHSQSIELREVSARRRERLSGICTESAVRALLYEISTTPKPGLVDQNNTGAHQDMNFFTFLDSIAVLSPWLQRFYLEGWDWRNLSSIDLFSRLRNLGRQAERDMFRATCGINTHKGIIFAFGILCGAMGHLQGKGIECVPLTDLRQACAELGQCALESFYEECPGMKPVGARASAASGFQLAIEAGLPCLRRWLNRGVPLNDAAAVTLLNLLARTEDTNIVRRGGKEQAVICRREAQKLLLMVDQDNWRQILEEMDQEYIRQNLSPGGCADLLAITLMFWFLGEQKALKLP